MNDSMFILIALICIGMGVFQILNPSFVRRYDRTYHKMRGVKPDMGEQYEIGRVVRAGLTILCGVVIILIIWLGNGV